MAPRISQATLVISGVLTGITAIAAVSYYNMKKTDTTSNSNSNFSNNDTNDTSADATTSLATPNGRTSRLRRSRTVRRRRNRTLPENNEMDLNNSISETEEDADNRKMLSLFKEWGDDDNRNLLNLLHAISENQSRKGKVS